METYESNDTIDAFRCGQKQGFKAGVFVALGAVALWKYMKDEPRIVRVKTTTRESE